MPAKLSKFAIEATCKEYVHPWSDSCISAASGLGLRIMQECLKIYSIFYFLTLLTRKRMIPTYDDLKNTLTSIMHSTAFLTWAGFAGLLSICSFRKLLGNFNILSAVFLPACFAGLTAIMLEKPSRRTVLSLYLSNIATESLFKMAVSRGYLPVVPRGEIVIFAAGMATLLYLYRNNRDNRDYIFKMLRIGLGPCEEKGCGSKDDFQSTGLSQNDIPGVSGTNQQKKFFKPNLQIIQQGLRVYKQVIDKIKAVGGRHTTCPHPYSCLHYTLMGGLKMFAIGLSVQVGLKLVLQLKNIIKRPKHLKKVIFERGNLNLACFLGGFASMYKSISCLLRKMYNKDSPNYAIIAGLLASTSFAMYPDNTIALYIAWKALQVLWNRGVEIGKVPEVKWFPIFLVSLSAGIIFHAAIVEPQNLRHSYWKFVYRASGGRIAMVSRLPLDEFGLESSKHLQDTLKRTRTHDKHRFLF